MNLDDLRILQSNERSSPQLQEVEKDLYKKIAEYIKTLEQKIQDTEDGDPDTHKIKDECESAKRVAESIFDKRLGKIIRLASLKASGLGKSPKSLTPEEQVIFDSLVETLEKGRASILGQIFTAPTKKAPAGEGKKETRGEITESHLRGEEENKKEFLAVRVLQDIPTFLGVDGRSYKLKQEDVVVLPALNAKIWIERKVAVPIIIPKEGRA
jgi:DNA replication factor GINS